MPTLSRTLERRPSAAAISRADDLAAVRQRGGRGGVDRDHLLDRGRDALDPTGVHLGFEGGDQRLVGDVVAEGVEADLAGIEDHLRCADQSLRGVDDADRPEGRRQPAEARPDADLLEERDRSGEERRRALIGRRPARSDEHDVVAGPRQEEGGGEADRACADNGDVADLLHSAGPVIAGRSPAWRRRSRPSPRDDPGIGSGRGRRAEMLQADSPVLPAPYGAVSVPGKQFAGLLASAGRIGESMG